MKKIITILLLALPFCGFAQSVTYDKDEGISKVEQKYKEVNKRVGSVNIYVIQVAALSGTNSGTQAQNMVKELNNFFASNHIQAEAYSMFSEPSHKILIGNFSTREAAFSVLVQLPSQYANAFVKQEKRKVSDIVD